MSTLKGYLSKSSIIIASFIALYSSQPYFAWFTIKIKVLLLALFLLFRFCLLKKRTLSVNKPAIFLCFVLWLYLYVWHSPQLEDVFSTFFTRFLPLIFVILFTSEEKKLFLTYTTNVYAVIALISLLFFAAWFLGIGLPSSILEHPHDSFYQKFTNYYLFIILGDIGIFTRFQSIFTEPGHLGMIMALLLYMNCYNFHKWQCWVFLVSLIWSFSLAAYILFLVGIIIYKVAISRAVITSLMKTFLLSALVAFSAFIFYLSYPDTLVSTLILSRLEYDSKLGVAGNNRNDASFMKYYKEFENKQEYITGIGIDNYSKLSFSGGNSSYRVFVVQYGLMGLILLLSFFASIAAPIKSKVFWGLFLLYCFSFYQRPYALWEVESFLFISFLGLVKYNKSSKCIGW